MHTNLKDIYDAAKNRCLDECVKCGNCITKCRIMPYTGLEEAPRKIQESILDFLRGGDALSPAAEKKVFACMRCFGCLDVKCAAKISSTMINELVEREMELRKDKPWDVEVYPSHEALARERTTEEEYKKITTPVINKDADILFFPGCNVYKQPDKILNAMDILDAIGTPYSFAPGMEYCCGWTVRGAAGDAEKLQKDAEKLMTFAESLKPKKMVFWCPTCMCVLQDRIHHFYAPDFTCITFGQYILDHIDKLSFPNAKSHKVTYHEPCKTSYMNIDRDSVRNVLKAIPGTELIEMAHHGENTMCCGCDAVDRDFPTGDRLTAARLKEAASTDANILIDVCHNCHFVFKPAQRAHNITGINIENYTSYILEAMGRRREDTL